MKDLKNYQFDKVAFLDLDGRGVRELTYYKNWVWVIAGPPEDKKEPFQHRRFSKDALKSDIVIETELIDNNLPSSSEGMAMSGNKAYVVIDGDLGKKGTKKCIEPSKYQVISLP